MVMNTIASLPPPIKQKFNPYLLEDYIDRALRNFSQITKKARKKIRKQDTKKQKLLLEYIQKFDEVYGRKKAEKAKYDAKIEKKIQERPFISNAVSPCRFRRVVTGKRSDV